jgi:hypothetical protein
MRYKPSVTSPGRLRYSDAMSTAELLQSARLLPPAERYLLAEAILESIDESDPAIQVAWAQASDERVQAWRDGKLQAQPLQPLMDELRRIA